MSRTPCISLLPDGGAVVRLSGELDLATAQPTQGMLDCAAAVASQLFVDLGGVDFMDPAGLGALVHIHNRVTAAGGTVELRRPCRQVRKLIELAGLSETLRIDCSPALTM